MKYLRRLLQTRHSTYGRKEEREIAELEFITGLGIPIATSYGLHERIEELPCDKFIVIE